MCIRYLCGGCCWHCWWYTEQAAHRQNHLNRVSIAAIQLSAPSTSITPSHNLFVTPIRIIRIVQSCVCVAVFFVVFPGSCSHADSHNHWGFVVFFFWDLYKCFGLVILVCAVVLRYLVKCLLLFGIAVEKD